MSINYFHLTERDFVMPKLQLELKDIMQPLICFFLNTLLRRTDRRVFEWVTLKHWQMFSGSLIKR